MPSSVEVVSIPDTVVLARTSFSKKLEAVPGKGDSPASLSTGHAPSDPTLSTSADRSYRQALLWASSRPEPSSVGGAATEPQVRKGVTTEGQKGGEGRTPRTTSPEVNCGLGGKGGSKQPCYSVPPVQHLYTEQVRGEEGLLRAARAICDCGRRRGGGGGGGYCTGDGLKLPLALLKIWGHESDKGGGRHLAPSGVDKKGRCPRRRLCVVS